MKKSLTPLELKVYFLCSCIPQGYVSTYKIIADSILSSPRVIGQILKKNPFDYKFVPCHRIIRSDLFIGGYQGRQDSISLLNKKKKLNKEGILFDEKGYLLTSMQSKIFKFFFK